VITGPTLRTAVALTLAAALLAGPVVTNPTPAAAATGCGPAGGAGWDYERPDSGDDFVFTGKGFGHGVGMSQYGARGAAKLGCTAAEIVSTYYQGVSATQKPMPPSIRVGLVPNSPASATTGYIPRPLSVLTFTNTSAARLPWLFQGTDMDKGTDLRELRDASGEPGPVQQPGTTWRIELKKSSTRAFYVITQAGTEVWSSESQDTAPGTSLVAALDNQRTVEIAEKRGREYRRGRLNLFSSTTGMYLTAAVDFEEYLFGLAEMPSSWEPEALKAQAIVGRSFASVSVGGSDQSNCRCDLYDSQYSQVYSGYDKESEGTDSRYGDLWVAAVEKTAGIVITRDGKVVTGNYASSHGGFSEDVKFVWGGSTPHLRAIDDSRWEAASGNPYQTWTKRFSPEALGKAFGVGIAINVELPTPRGVSGRIGNPARGAGGVTVFGTDGTVTVSGDRVRSLLGLRSTLFNVLPPGEPLTGDTPLTGDWDGDGKADLGWFLDGEVNLQLADGRVLRFHFGRAGDIPVAGDWNGDGRDTIGVVRDQTWFLRNTNSTGGADKSFLYGRPGDRPLPGNWDGVPGDEAGILRDGTWHLNDKLAGGTARWSFVYGRLSAGDVPITGDWNGEGQDRVGIVRDGEWHLRNTYAGGASDTRFTYGRVSRGDLPVTGDWDGDNDETPGVVRNGTWYLRNANAGGAAQRTAVIRG
jgi:SpoIID/LytB domain protein